MNMNDDGVVVAVGCEDGGIKLFGMPLRTSEGDNGRKEEIEFRRAYPSCGSRVLSVGWRTDGASLFAGCSDSTLRCLDAATGQCLFVCGLEGGVDFDTAIWALKVLKNGTVVTGDSSGKITVCSALIIPSSLIMICCCAAAANVVILSFISPPKLFVPCQFN